MLPERLTTKLGFAPQVDLSQRADPAQLPELMDEPGSYEELVACLEDLAQVNRITGAYRPTLQFLSRAAAHHLPSARPLEILDVGFGYGDTLRAVRRWAGRRRLPVRLTGIDLQPLAARAAAAADRKAGVPSGEIRWLTGDASAYLGPQPDLILSSLVMHHLRDAEIVPLLAWMKHTARLGWFINDLERAERPYRWFGVLARVMRWHPYVRHDGPVSFRRAFRPADWERLLLEAGVPGARLVRVPPARLCVEQIH